MITIYGIDKDYEGNWETVLQAERWLDEKGITKALKKRGLIFQGLTYEDTGELKDLLTYKTKLDRDVYMLVVDLNGGGTTVLERTKPTTTPILMMGAGVSPDPDSPIIIVG